MHYRWRREASVINANAKILEYGQLTRSDVNSRQAMMIWRRITNSVYKVHSKYSSGGHLNQFLIVFQLIFKKFPNQMVPPLSYRKKKSN